MTGAPSRRRAGCRLAEEAGMTIVELMVAISIFGILTTLAFTTVMNGASNLKTVRQTSDLNEESRLVLNRMSRELREACCIVSAQNPDASNPDGSERICGSAPWPCFNPNGDVSLTFDVDFNGINGIEPNATDPEQLTYRYDFANKRLLLQTSTQTTPILAANVSSFKLTYRSSQYKCDVNYDGQVTWQELESAASPPCPPGAGEMQGGISGLDAELPYIDQIIIDMTVLTPPREQRYRTKVDLRNRTLS